MWFFFIVLLPVLSRANVNEGVIFTNAPRVATQRLPKVNLGTLKGGRRLSGGWRDDVEMFTLSDEWKAMILQKHNSLRAQVGDHAPCTATDMATLVWDDTLAAGAAAWAAQCTWAHDEVANTENSWGENLAFQWSSLDNVPTQELMINFMQAWYNETYDTEWFDDYVASKVYDDPEAECRSYDRDNENCMIGHYTQLIWAASTKIGCAVSVCPEYSSAEEKSLLGNGGVYLACKYSPPGNYGNEVGGTNLPYVQGQACAQCKDNCDESGYLCTANTEITRCRDAIEDYSFFEVQSVQYTDCDSLIAGVADLNFQWCDANNMEEKYQICQRTCGACSVAAELGLEYCGLPPTTTTTMSTRTSTTTTMTTWTTTVTTTWTTTSSRAVITGSMTIEGLSYSALTNQGGLEASVKDKLRESIAQEAGDGIGANNVEVETSPGSVAVQFSITAPPTVDPATTTTTLRTSPSLSITILDNIQLVPGIEAATTGALSVSGFQVLAPGEEPPTAAPTAQPTVQPTQAPTAQPTVQPTQATPAPTQATPTPTQATPTPTEAPTVEGTTDSPTLEASGTTWLALPRVLIPMILLVITRSLVV